MKRSEALEKALRDRMTTGRGNAARLARARTLRLLLIKHLHNGHRTMHDMDEFYIRWFVRGVYVGKAWVGDPIEGLYDARKLDRLGHI